MTQPQTEPGQVQVGHHRKISSQKGWSGTEWAAQGGDGAPIPQGAQEMIGHSTLGFGPVDTVVISQRLGLMIFSNLNYSVIL